MIRSFGGQSDRLLVFMFFLFPVISEGCTTILVGKNATADGSVLHGHNEDMGFTAVGRLWYVPSLSHKQGDKVKVPYVTLDLPAETFAYWASGNAYGTAGLGIASEMQPYDSVLVGMNEFGVTMSCNWMYSKEENLPGKGVRRYAMRQLILERAKTAKDAVKLVGDLIDKHGQADWGGLTYCLADPEEAWIIETTSRNWAARRVKDDEVLVVANRFTIGEKFDIASHGLVSAAVEKGWHDPSSGTFNFRKTYGNPERMASPYDIDRENRAYSLLKDKEGAILLEDLMAVLSDAYEGTTRYHKPINHMEPWEDVTDKLLIPRAIRTSLCQSSSVAHLRGNMPVEVGSVMWYTMNVPGYSGYFPVYAGALSIPEEFQIVNSAYSQNSAWWTTRMLQKITDLDHDLFFSILKGFWEANRAGIRLSAADMEKRALQLLKNGRKEEGIKLLDRFTYSQAKNVLQNTHVFLRKFQDKTGNAPVY
ncbi:C69 family dipeptidase [Aminivibrio sp.]|uniref:C69 family dipeptidase n=1 Tax=Aminivibrio sp. TaxID=1872489 RepID=UPI003D978C80